jgi:hypothetical protein
MFLLFVYVSVYIHVYSYELIKDELMFVLFNQFLISDVVCVASNAAFNVEVDPFKD